MMPRPLLPNTSPTVFSGSAMAIPVGISLQPPAGSSTVRDYVENQLLAYVDSQRQAEEIAEKCGITLESCRHGIAVFYTEEDLDSIIALAQQLQLPQLSRNYIYQLYGEE